MNKRTVIIAAVAALGITAWLIFGTRTLAAGLVYPVENFFRKAGGFVSLRIGGFINAGATAKRNEELEREISLLRLVRKDNENLRAENKRLRGLIGFNAAGGKGRWIPATILSRNGTTGVRRFLRVDRGTLCGVRKGAAVATPDGVVGRIAEAGLNESMVLPITDPAVRVACEIIMPEHSAKPVYGILYGNAERTGSREYVSMIYATNPLRIGHLAKSPDLSIPVNARIVTSGLGGVFPKGLPVGHLLDGTSDDDSRLERQGDVVPAVDFPSLKYVFIRRED